jgi:hypothetical protein
MQGLRGGLHRPAQLHGTDLRLAHLDLSRHDRDVAALHEVRLADPLAAGGQDVEHRARDRRRHPADVQLAAGVLERDHRGPEAALGTYISGCASRSSYS